MRASPPISLFAILLGSSLGACNGTDDPGPLVSGGAPAAGGALVGGANSASGGGGAAGSSGAVGGMSAVGSSIPAGGATNPATTPATGGVPASGGTSATSAKGGSSSTGGTSAKGGSSSTGGTSAKGGGSSSTGGTSAKGGSSSTGGTSAKGGSSSTGGTTSIATFKCNNLLSAAGATGQAKPSGAVGGLKVLNWAGFSSAISYTFDDANSSQINNYAALKNAGGRYTFYLQTAKTEAGNAIWKTALQDGHELGNHTSTHDNCTSAGPIDAAQSFIQSNFGVTAYAFAAPNGATACQTYSSKFLTNRSVAGGSSISPGVISNLSWIPSDIASASALAPASGKWRILCIHGFTGGTDGAYQPIALSSFTSAVSSAVSGGSWVDTITNVAAYQYGQNAIASKTGNSISWTLPTVFPPNMCVRVTTTGGTVKQNGAAVPWNARGYYEISLDAKSVTVE